MSVHASRQIRRALLQLLFPGKPFDWLRHVSIAQVHHRQQVCGEPAGDPRPKHLGHQWSDVTPEGFRTELYLGLSCRRQSVDIKVLQISFNEEL